VPLSLSEAFIYARKILGGGNTFSTSVAICSPFLGLAKRRVHCPLNAWLPGARAAQSNGLEAGKTANQRACHPRSSDISLRLAANGLFCWPEETPLLGEQVKRSSERSLDGKGQMTKTKKAKESPSQVES